MFVLVFWPFNIIACIAAIAGVPKLIGYICTKLNIVSDLITPVSIILGIFIAYQISKLTHIWPWSDFAEKDKEKEKKIEKKHKWIFGIDSILDNLGIAFLAPFALIFLLVWIIS